MGRPARTSRAAILDAALTVADDDGLDAVTMQTVARRLGLTTMALYRHVADKADLLDGLVELLLTQFPLPPGEMPWQTRLERLAHGVRGAATRHPGVFPLLLRRPVNTEPARRVRDATQAAYREAGLGPETAARAERLISTAVLGFAASEAAGRFAHHDPATLDADFACLLRSVRLLVEAAAAPADLTTARTRNQGDR
jgi:AcrR family transcriptional regulator